MLGCVITACVAVRLRPRSFESTFTWIGATTPEMSLLCRKDPERTNSYTRGRCVRSSSDCTVRFIAVMNHLSARSAAQVRHAYFKARRGNRLTLYADAHADQRTLQPIPLPDGRAYQPASCWDDLMRALLDAKYFIYITGVRLP